MVPRIASLSGFRFAQDVLIFAFIADGCVILLAICIIASALTRTIANSLARTFAGSHHGFIADVKAVAVPAATGVGEVEEVVEVDVEVGLGEEAEFFVGVFFPDVAVVIF